MKKKLSPEIKAKMKKYILDAIDFSGYDGIITNTEREKLEAVWATFKKEYCYPENLRYYGSEQKVFENWLMGLPSCFSIDFENYRILEILKEWDILPVNATERQEDVGLNQWWARIFMLFSKLLRESQKPSKPVTSPYERKTVKEYQIHGFYSGEWEEVTAEAIRKEALERLSEYQENEPSIRFKLVVKRIKKDLPTLN